MSNLTIGLHFNEKAFQIKSPTIGSCGAVFPFAFIKRLRLLQIVPRVRRASKDFRYRP